MHMPDGEDEVCLGEAGMTEGELWWRVRDTHPSCGHRTARGDWTTVQKVSDFATLREFRRTPIYDAFYRGFLDHWLDVGLAAEPARTCVFIFARHTRRDFDERDRLGAELVQPPLARRAETAEAALRAAAALAAVEEGTGSDAQSVVLCSSTGVIEFASASSRKLLQQYIGIQNGHIPAAVLRRRHFLARHGDHELHVHIARTGDLRVLMLDERDRRLLLLTARERQILEQVALGKKNEAIALELKIASATVAKHLEHTYRKLDVPNRAAAAAHLQRHGLSVGQRPKSQLLPKLN